MTADGGITRVASVGSTMEAVHELAQNGAPSGTAVVAREQTEGRGSRGRAWSSPPGGLWASVLARPVSAALELLSLRAGFAMVEALAPFIDGAELGIKWPNDLMLDELKVGGILCEARWAGPKPAWVVIGVGLNVANRPDPGLSSVATSLCAMNPDLTPDLLEGPVIGALRGLDAAAGPLSAAELARFAGRDWLAGRPVSGPPAGTADGIQADGTLRVRTRDGTIETLRSGTMVLTSSTAPWELRPCS